MSVDFVVVQRAIRLWVTTGSGLPIASVYWGQQDSARVAEPAIEMRILASHTLGQAWRDNEANPAVTVPFAVTAFSGVANTLTSVLHGHSTGDGPFQISATIALPPGLLPFTNYWLVRVDADTFRFAASYVKTGGPDIAGAPSGEPVTTVTLGTLVGPSGSVTVVGTAATLHAGQEFRQVSRAIERLTLTLECHTTAAVGMQSAVALLSKVKARQRLPSQLAILAGAHLGLIDVQRVRAIHGVRNAVMFEPRAIMEVLLSLPTEEFEYIQVIERVAVRDLVTGQLLPVG